MIFLCDSLYLAARETKAHLESKPPRNRSGPRSTSRHGHWGCHLLFNLRMHMGARLPAARCLAQAQAFANALAVAPRLDNKLLPFSHRQTRLVSSKPDSSPDKPPENTEDGKDGAKEKEGEHASQPPISSETSESATEAKRQPLFAPLGGRGRSNNSSGSNSGLPPFTLPPWFLDNQVQILGSKTSTTGKGWDGIWRYLKPLQSESTSIQDIGGIWASSEHGQASSEPPERAIGRELVSTVSAELEAIAPSHRATKEARRRPISLLYVHNYKGSRVANDVIGHIGADLGADVVHIDATKVARLIAPYFGSTLYFGRGKMSMLGYAVSEANGRSRVAASAAGSDGEEDFLSIRGMGVMKFLQSSDNERVTWDDLKLNHVIKELANAANIKRTQVHPEASKPERVIVHIHNYIELTMTPEGASILHKLRTVVDRLWQDGSKIVIVGSASNDDNASAKWHTKVKELSSQDCYPFVFSPKADELPALKAWERDDYLVDNLSNINWMLQCLRAEPADLVMPARKPSEPVEALDELRDCLSNGICTNHWVFRLCTQAIGCQRYRDSPIDVHTLAEALRHMRRVDRTRSTILGIQDTSNPQSAGVSDSSSSPLESLVSLGNNRPGDHDRRKPPKNVNFDDEEKKLLSGLVDVRDIHTTFDDVIAPPDVRDSLIALT